MFKYSKYLFSNILSKKGFWITLLISLITLTAVGLFRIKDANEHGHSAINSMDTETKFLPFIFGVLITCLIVVYIFKDGVEDGTELMIASKPLHRNRIIFGKFLVLILMIIMYQILILIDSIIYAQWDDFTTTQTKWRFASSLSIGGLIILLIIGSIMSFLAIFLSRIGLLSLGIVTSAIIPIVSAIVAPISKGTPHDMLSAINYRGKYMVEHDKLENLIINSEKIYENYMKDPNPPKTNEELNQHFNLSQYIYDTDLEMTLQKTEKKDIIQQREYFDTRWYGKFAPYDVWYQWSGFYDIFMNSAPSSMTPYRWELEDSVVNYDKRYSMDPTGTTRYKDVFIVMDNRSLAANTFNSKGVRDIEELIMDNKKDDPMTGEKVKPKFNDPDVSLEERLQIMMHLINDTRSKYGLRYDEYLLYQRVVRRLKAETPNEYVEPTHIFKTGSSKPRTLSEWQSNHSFLLIRGDHFNKWVGHKYMERSTKVYIWSAIAGFIFLLTIGTYLRKDFK